MRYVDSAPGFDSPCGILGAHIFDLRKYKFQTNKFSFEREDFCRSVAIGLDEFLDVSREFCEGGYAGRKADGFRHPEVLSRKRR